MEDNWIALFVSIIACKSVDKSLMSLGIIRKRKETINGKYHKKYTEDEIKEMVTFKEGRKWKEVAKKYDITINMAYAAINNYKKRNG